MRIIMCMLLCAVACGVSAPDNYPPEPPKGANGPAEPKNR